MCNNSRIYNVSRGFSLKHKQALRAIENCAATWVEFGVSIRDLTLAESIAARNAQAQAREPLASVEIPGLRFEPSESGKSLTTKGFALIREANQLATA